MALKDSTNNCHLFHNSKIFLTKPFAPVKTKRFIPTLKRANFESHKVPRISVIGIDKLFYDDYCKRAKVIWLIALICATCFCLKQLHECACHFLSNPVIKQTDIIRNSTVTFPTIILCPAVMRELQPIFCKLNSICEDGTLKCHVMTDFFKNNLLHVFPLFNDKDLAEKAWESHNIDKLIKVYTACNDSKQECDVLGKKLNVSRKKIYSFWGKCVGLDTAFNWYYKGPLTYLKIHYTNQMYNWIQSKMNSDLKNNSINETDKESIRKSLNQLKFGLMIATYPNLNYNRQHNLYFDMLEVYQGFETHIQLRRKESHQKHRKQFPCKNEDFVIDCFNNCFETKLSNNTECKMPYQLDNSTASCKWNLNAVKIYLNHSNVYNQFRLFECNCPPICEEVTYTMTTDVVSSLYNDSDVVVKFYFSDNTHDYTSERFSYDSTSLFSDIGGSLGFFLGLCALTVLEIMEVALFYIYKMLR